MTLQIAEFRDEFVGRFVGERGGGRVGGECCEEVAVGRGELEFDIFTIRSEQGIEINIWMIGTVYRFALDEIGIVLSGQQRITVTSYYAFDVSVKLSLAS